MARISKFAATLTLSLAAGLAVLAPTGAEAQDKVYTASELSTPASIKSPSAAATAIERNYPTALQRVGGKVQLQFIVEPDGSVNAESIKVLVASTTALGEAASRAVKSIQFNPGKVDGAPVRAVVSFPVVYAVR